MRVFDRDLIRGGHYGQRPGVPHSKAEHMAAPTNAVGVKKVLANPEPSTHGPFATSRRRLRMSANWGRPEATGWQSKRRLWPISLKKDCS